MSVTDFQASTRAAGRAGGRRAHRIGGAASAAPSSIRSVANCAHCASLPRRLGGRAASHGRWETRGSDSPNFGRDRYGAASPPSELEPEPGKVPNLTRFLDQEIPAFADVSPNSIDRTRLATSARLTILEIYSFFFSLIIRQWTFDC